MIFTSEFGDGFAQSITEVAHGKVLTVIVRITQYEPTVFIAIEYIFHAVILP